MSSSDDSTNSIRIDEDRSESTQKMKLIRQDRFDIVDENFQAIIDGRRHQILNYSAFGVVVQADVPLNASEYFDVPLVFENIEIGKFHLKIVRRVKTEGVESAACELIGEPISIAMLDAIRRAQSILKVHEFRQKEYQNVPAKFKQKVFDAKEQLESLQDQIENLEKEINWESQNQVSEYEEYIPQVMGYYFGEKFPALFESLRNDLTGVDQETIKNSMEFFREKLKHLIYKSPFANRAYKKPLGYAGDFQMMNIIYENKTTGDSLFSKCINRYFMDVAACKAVRNRAYYLAEKIVSFADAKPKEYDTRILSVACGPAKELYEVVVEKLGSSLGSCTFNLLDQDEKALKYAQRVLRGASKETRKAFDFNFIRRSIRDVIKSGLEGHQYDLIYTAGLFDYLSDPVAQRAAERMHSSLRPGGQLIIGNFNVNNSSQLMMEFAMDWTLIYRSEADLRKLFSFLDKNLVIESESEGINLFCIIKK